jgi:hypothetical protein
VRVREFDDLFAGSLRGVERLDDRRVRIELDPTPDVAARTAQLAVRETSCCAFFTFTLTAGDGRLRLDIAAPGNRADVLDALAARVER